MYSFKYMFDDLVRCKKFDFLSQKGGKNFKFNISSFPRVAT